MRGRGGGQEDSGRLTKDARERGISANQDRRKSQRQGIDWSSFKCEGGRVEEMMAERWGRDGDERGGRKREGST